MSWRRAGLALGLAALCAPRLCAEPGRTAAVTLQRPLGTRPVGLGQAFTAVSGGLDSLSYNPAGAAGLAQPELLSSYARGIVDDNFGFVGYAHPFSFMTVSAGFAYYNAGTINLHLSDGTQGSRTAQQDILGLASLAVPMAGGVNIGATFKLLRQELAQEARATNYAADLGVLWNSPLKGLSLGVSLQNMGPDVKFEEEADPLPLTTRFGAAYNLDIIERGWMQQGDFGFSRFLFTLDVIKLRDQSDLLPSTGLEMGLNIDEDTSGCLRVGYLLSREINSLTAGLGLKEGRWRLDYAFGLMKRDIANTNQFTIGVQF